jgi:cytoskeletal protein RodZ
MAKFFRGNERGAVTGYAISVIILAVILVGGVVLLKNIGGAEPETNKPVAVETGEFKADDEKPAETKKDETAVKDNDDKTETAAPAPTTTPNTTDTVATTGATEEYTPEKLTATGPEDFALVIIGLVLAGATFYTACNYVRSRAAINAALLRK